MENGPFTGFTNENGGSLPWQTVSLPEEKEDETGLKSLVFGPLPVGSLEHEVLFHSVGNVIIPIGFHVFQRVGIPTTRSIFIHRLSICEPYMNHIYYIYIYIHCFSDP